MILDEKPSAGAKSSEGGVITTTASTTIAAARARLEKDKELNEAVQKLNNVLEKGVNQHSSKNQQQADNSTENGQSGIHATQHAMKPLQNNDSKDTKAEPKPCGHETAGKEQPLSSTSAQSLRTSKSPFVAENSAPTRISSIKDINCDEGHPGSSRGWNKCGGLLFSASSLPSSSKSSFGLSNNCHSRVAEQIAVLFVRDDSGRMRTLHKLVAVVAVLPTLAICLTVALASTSSEWRYPLLPWQEAYLNRTETQTDSRTSSNQQNASPLQQPASPPTTYTFPSNRRDQQSTPVPSVLFAAHMQQQQNQDPINVMNFGDVGFLSDSVATSNRQVAFEDVSSRHGQVDMLASEVAFKRRGGYDSSSNNRADVHSEEVFSISTVPPLPINPIIHQNTHQNLGRTSETPNDDSTSLEIRIKGTVGYRYPHETNTNTGYNHEEPSRTRDDSYIELDTPMPAPSPSPAPNAIPIHHQNQASLLARLRRRYEQAQVQWLQEEKRRRHGQHQLPALMASMSTTPSQLMSNPGPNSWSIHGNGVPSSPLGHRIGTEHDESALGFVDNLTPALSMEHAASFASSTVGPAVAYLSVDATKSQFPPKQHLQGTPNISSAFGESGSLQHDKASAEMSFTGTMTDNTGFPAKKPFGLGLMIPKIPLRKKLGVFTELSASTLTKDHHAASSVHQESMGKTDKPAAEFMIGDGRADLQDAIPDALTVEELLSGKLDIETGIEEAVKAAYKSRGLDITDGMCDSYDLACMDKYSDNNGNSSPPTSSSGSDHSNHNHQHDSSYGGIRQYVSKGNFFRDRRFNLFVTGLLRNLAIEIRNFDNDPLFFRVYRPFEVEPGTFDLSTFVLGRRFGRSLPTNSPSLMHSTDIPALPRTGTTLLERLMHRFSGQEGRMKADASMMTSSSTMTMNNGGLLAGLRRNNRNRRKVVGGGVLRGLSNVTRTDDAQIQVLGSSSTLVRSDVALGPLTMELKLTLSRRRGLLRRRSEEDKIVVNVGRINLQTFTYIDDHGSSMADFTMLPIDIDRIQITLPEIRRMQQQATMEDGTRDIVQKIFSTKGFLARRLEEYARTAMTSNIYSDAKKHPMRGGFQAIEYQ